MRNICALLLSLVFTLSAFSQVPYYYYQVPSGTTNNLYDIKYINISGSNNNYICGANGILLQQQYEDSSFLPVVSNTTIDLNSFLINTSGGESPLTFFIFGTNGNLLRYNSSNGWFQQYSGYSYNLNGGVFIGFYSYSDRFITVGANGIILKRMNLPSLDTNWVIVQSGTSNTLKCICAKSKYVWTAGANGTILKSNDTGNTWNQQSSPVTNNFNSIWFLDSISGIVVGDAGIILKTTNGGLNWVQKTSGTVQNLNYIYYPSQTILYISGNKTILISSNNGETWYQDTGVPQFNLFSCGFLNSKYYGTGIPYFVGENGKIFRKTLDTIFHPNIWTQLKPNNISAYFSNRGIFDQSMTLSGNSGFEWPKGSGKTAIFTAGLCIGAFVNGQLREAMASYYGEYLPGYCMNGNFITNDYFKIYKVNKSDNAQTNWDWANWGQMVPYGAPFIDVNHDGIYEPAIDTPGVSNAKETIFLCVTDANPLSHTSGEGFGAGTLPLGSEVHMTAWAYDAPGLQDVQFINFEIINKSASTWNAVKTAIFCDAEIGDALDDYFGCDTTLKLGFGYNGDNYDNEYGTSPPAAGILLLTSPLNRNITPNVRLNMTSFTDFKPSGTNPPPCEADATGEPYPAYLMMSGFKKDSTSYLDVTQNPPKKTKFEFTGDPETNAGWTEVKGYIGNCGLDSTGLVHVPSPPGDRKFILGSGANNFNIIPGESQKFVIAQLIARDSGNLKSVTKLKRLSVYVRNFYEQNFPINVNQISTNIPLSFELKQNYPNPFNPSTIIRYQIKDSRFVTLKVYDILGREIETLVNEFQKAGTHETQFPDNNAIHNQLASGVYFYKLVVGDFVAVKKMILMK